MRPEDRWEGTIFSGETADDYVREDETRGCFFFPLRDEEVDEGRNGPWEWQTTERYFFFK